MWVWAIRTAVFINNITASYFSKERVWATPYELVHGEPFPDASIVFPFGCAALILLDQKDLTKFGNRCAMMVFVHYADEHPLYTYAFYSPLNELRVYRVRTNSGTVRYHHWGPKPHTRMKKLNPIDLV